MKNLAFTILIAFFTFTLSNAQNSTIEVQAAIVSIDLLKENASEFNSIVENLMESFEKKNANIASSNKAPMMKILMESTNTTQSLSRILKAQVDGGLESRNGQDEVEVDQGTISEPNKFMMPLKFSKDEANDFYDFAIEMEAIQKNMRANNFEIHPNQENAEANIEMLSKYAQLLSKTTDLFILANSRTQRI